MVSKELELQLILRALELIQGKQLDNESYIKLLEEFVLFNFFEGSNRAGCKEEDS